MTVIYVKPSNSKGYISVCVGENGEKKVFVVREAAYESLNAPLRGDELDECAISRLSFENEVYTATIKALRILSYGDNSKARLYEKLAAKGISKDVAKSTVREMVRLGYINEERSLERLIISEVNVGLLGKRKLIPKLVSKGYSREDVTRVIKKLLDIGEIDFELSKEALIEKKLPHDASREEISALLYKFGY